VDTYNNEQVSKVLSRISAETYLKLDYFGSKSQKIVKHWELCPQTTLPPAAGGFTTWPLKWLENVQDPTPIEITDLCRCLENLGQKRNLHFLPPLPYSKNVLVTLLFAGFE